MKEIIWAVWGVLVAMVGYTIHGSVFWCTLDFIFSIFTPLKWLICHEVTFAIIKQTFNFLG